MTGKHYSLSFGCLGLALLVTGCVATKPIKPANPDESVRSVDFTKAPELQEFAERARQFGNEMYPRVCALLIKETTKPPRQFDLILAPLKSRNTAEAHLETQRIYINSDYLTNSPDLNERFEKIFVHEMAHMATQCRRSKLIFWKSEPAGNNYWSESIADYAFYKLIGTNGWGCPECNQRFPHYTSGYSCGGAFLLYLENKHGTNLVRELATALHQRNYSDSFFDSTTGQSLDALWTSFQKTAAFKPGAKRLFELQQALGYVNGQPPRNLEKRFKKLIDQTADSFTKRMVASATLDGNAVSNLTHRLALYLYFSQPGGTPEQLLSDLRERGELPGFATGEKGRLSTTFNYDVMETRTFPVTHTMTGSKTNDTSRYHYTVVCASEGAEWRLEKAWRTAPDGKILEEFSMP